MRLKNLRIYALPDGGRYVADVRRGGYDLVPFNVWNFARVPRYRVTPEGQVLADGGPTDWRVEHLQDTGRDAQYPRPNAFL